MNTNSYEQTAILYLDDTPLSPDNSEMTQQMSVRPAQSAPMNIVRGTPPGVDWQVLRTIFTSLIILVTMIGFMPLILRLFALHKSSTVTTSKNLAAKNLFENPVRYQSAVQRVSPSLSMNPSRRIREQVFTVDPGAPMPDDGSF